MDTVNLAIAALGSTAAIAAAVISWLVYRGQRAEGEPIVSASLERFEKTPLFVLRVNVGGRSQVAWDGIQVAVLGPDGARIVSKGEGKSQDETGQEVWDINKATAALAPTQRMTLVSQPYYPVPLSSRYVGANLGYVWEEFLVDLPSAAVRLEVQVSLKSQEANGRMVRKKITREVPR